MSKRNKNNNSNINIIMQPTTIHSTGNSSTDYNYYYATYENNNIFHYVIEKQINHKRKDGSIHKTYANTLLYLSSKTYDENFAQAIFSFFESYIKTIEHNDDNNIFVDRGKYIYNDRSPFIEDLIKNHKDSKKPYSREEVIELLIKIDIKYKKKDEKLIPQLLKDFNSKFNAFNTSNNMTTMKNIYVRPYFADLEPIELDILTEALKPGINDTKEIAKMSYKIYEITHLYSTKDFENNKDVLVKDYQTGKKIKGNITQYSVPTRCLPLKTEKFREYLDTITVSDVKKIYRKIPTTATASAAIDYANAIINDEIAEPYTLDEINKVIENINNAAKKNKINAQRLIKYMEESYSKNYHSNVIQAIGEYLTHNDFTKEDVNYALNNFLYDRNAWTTNYKLGDYIIQKLAAKTNYIQAYKIMQEVITQGVRVTPAQWERYIENYEDYKDMPASWWHTFVKN